MTVKCKLNNKTYTAISWSRLYEFISIHNANPPEDCWKALLENMGATDFEETPNTKN